MAGINKQPIVCGHGITESVWVNSLCQTTMHIHNRVMCSDCFHSENFLYFTWNSTENNVQDYHDYS